jgi:hypothetical protein
MTPVNFALFALFVEHVRDNFPDLSYTDLRDFCDTQYPIVERALHFGEGIRACTSRAHDLTCQFVEQQLYGTH